MITPISDEQLKLEARIYKIISFNPLLRDKIVDGMLNETISGEEIWTMISSIPAVSYMMTKDNKIMFADATVRVVQSLIDESIYKT